MVLQSTQDYPTGLFDFFPLYYGARAWLTTGSAYNLAAVAPPAPGLLDLGNAYPFPAVLLVLPLTALPPPLAGVVWTGVLTLGLVTGVSLVRGSGWLLLYLPLLEALRLEQFSALVVAMQLGALWALRARRWWWLGVLQCLLLTKPNQAALFVVVVLLLGRNWKQLAVCLAVVWGGSVVLSPSWPLEWWPVVLHNVDAVPRPVYWWLAPLLVPLLLARDWISLSEALPVLLGQFRDVYVAAPLPLGVVDVRRSVWLAPLSMAWLLVSGFWNQAWGTALLLVLPVVVLSVWRWRTLPDHHVPQHQDIGQLRATGDRRRDPGRGVAVRTQVERDGQTVTPE